VLLPRLYNLPPLSNEVDRDVAALSHETQLSRKRAGASWCAPAVREAPENAEHNAIFAWHVTQVMAHPAILM
jgi:hypothetical protein